MNWIVANRASLTYFLPEMFLIGVCLLTLVLAAARPTSRRFAIGLGYFGMAGFLGLSLQLFGTLLPKTLFSGAIALDSFAIFFKIFFAVVTSVTLFFISKSKEYAQQGLAEVVGFLMAITVGMSMMAASTDLIMLFLSLEMVSILSYIMVGLKEHSRVSAEAGLKYILYGALASGVMIFGFSYIFGLVGSTDLRDIAHFFQNLSGISSAPVVLFALICIMVGFGFKIATFPTHMWCPDVYEGAPTAVTAFLSVGPKAAGFAMTIRFFFMAFGIDHGKGVAIFEFINWSLLVAILAAITMTIGNLAAIPQRNLKRLMAYSSIAHAGYLLMGFATLSPEGIQAILFYLITYLLMNFGAFLVILAIADRKGTEEIDGYRGLGWTSPIMAGALTVFLFSLTGLPPFAGFIGKFFLFAAVIKHGLYWLAVVAVINSVISLFYYARIIKAMYLTMPLSPAPIAVAGAYRTLAWILAIPTLILGIYWEPLATFAARSAASFF